MERILVVDDETHVVRLLKKFLGSKKYEVYTATNGIEAIEKKIPSIVDKPLP